MQRRHFIAGLGASAALAAGGAITWRHACGSPDSYSRYQHALRRPLTHDAPIHEVLRYASLAANGHNTQPWLFKLSAQHIAIVPDLTRRTAVVDPDDHHVYASLGCAAENLRIAASSSGLAGHVDIHSNGHIHFRYQNTKAVAHPLLSAIPSRQSTRSLYSGQALSKAQLLSLEQAASLTGVHLFLLEPGTLMSQVRDLVIAGNDLQMRDAAFMNELKLWLRFNPNVALHYKDGLYSACSANPVMPQSIGRHAFDLFFNADQESNKYAAHINSSAGLAIFVAEQNSPQYWALAGQACQRFSLAATNLGLKTAFVNQATEVPSLRQELAQLLGTPNLRPNIVMRFGYAASLPYSARRPVQAVSVLKT